MSYAKDPQHFVEMLHVRHPSTGTAGTLNQTTRIDAGKYDFLLVLLSVASTAQIDLTPLVYDAPTGGTGTRLDGTGGQQDYSIHYAASDDNKGAAVQIPCRGLPKRYLGFEQVLAGTSVYSIVALGFMSLSSRDSDFHAPLALTDAKGASSGFS